MLIVVDDRERKIVPHMVNLVQELGSSGNLIKVDRIHVGDYAICTDDESICAAIERKTWKDLSASIKDGRKENVSKLLALRESTGARLFYIIEGPHTYKPDRKISGIPFKNLQAHLDHLIYRDGIHVIYAQNCQHVAQRIFELTKVAFKYVASGGERNGSLLKVVPSKSVREMACGMIAAIKGVTSRTADLYLDSGRSISDIFEHKYDITQIAQLRYDSGVSIGARAKKIAHAETDANTQISMLSSIQGITTDTAAIILASVQADALTSTSIETIADICRKEGKKAGLKAIEKLVAAIKYRA